MPEFDFGDWPQVPTMVPGYRIQATMHYPENPLRREELHMALVVAYVLRAAKDLTAWKRLPTAGELLPLLQARHEGRDYKAVLRALAPKQRQGAIAGEVLLLIQSSSAHGYQGSVLKACYIQVELAKKAKATGKTAMTAGRTKITYMNPQALMEKAWVPYKGVAHLWAAHNWLVGKYSQRDAEGRISLPDVQWFFVTDAFLEFLALAESFRQFGETYIPSPADRPILDPRTTWRVPAHVQLPVLGPYDPPPLSPETLDALACYRA